LNSASTSPDALPRSSVGSAREFAIKAHGWRTYGGKPYHAHLQAVSNVLLDFRFFDPILIQSAWLHDVLEDTAITYEQIESKFGKVVAEIVRALTSEPGENRQQRNAATYPKIASNRWAIAVKLADRIANVRECVSMKDPRLSMYLKEHRGFRRALYRTDPTTRAMWAELDAILLVRA
jgi:(p)ppGpp synthase/HD superfamily hydrolase